MINVNEGVLIGILFILWYWNIFTVKFCDEFLIGVYLCSAKLIVINNNVFFGMAR